MVKLQAGKNKFISILLLLFTLKMSFNLLLSCNLEL